MALLDQILGNIMQSQTGAPSSLSGISSVLMNLLGSGANSTAGEGGLTSLIARFEQAGLGNIAQSWVGNGANQPVSPQQLHTVIGDDHVQNMANQAGMAPHDLLTLLSQHLPQVVDGITPNGKVPEEGPIYT